MREFNLDQLRTLVVIVEHGSFAEAARRLHLAPPTVSLHISELETRIGARLLSRTRGAVRPTAIGESLVEHARRLLADVAHVMDDMARQSKGLAGRVRIGSSTGVIAHLLPRALEILADTHPDIDVQIAVLTSHQSLERLASGALDIGIVALPQAKVAGLVIEPWRRDPILTFLKAAQENPAEATPQWMASQALILNGAGTHLSQLIGNWFADAGLRPKPRISLDYNDAIKNLVGAGYGSTLLPHEEGALLSDQRVVTRPLDPPLWRELGMAYRQGEQEPATAYLLQALFSLQQQ
jgi:DNA-binding transcriptional LysR family regulator